VAAIDIYDFGSGFSEINLASLIQIRDATSPPLVFYAYRTSPNVVRLQFNNALSGVSTSTASYGITGPSAITVSSVAYNLSSAYVDLTVTGGFVSGTYTAFVTGTAAVVDVNGSSNDTTGRSFSVIGSGSNSGSNSAFNPGVN
jgi:hypothetical protein